MNKRCRLSIIVLAFINILFIPFLFAQAPELKNVMPNSWEKITRLSPTEEHKFIEENWDIVVEIVSNCLENWRSYDAPNNTFKHNRVYREELCGETFFRVIITQDQEPTFDNFGYRFFQGFVHRKNNTHRLLMINNYNYYMAADISPSLTWVSSIDLIDRGNGKVGVMISGMGIAGTRKNQLVGKKVSAYYYFLEDFSDNSLFYEYYHSTLGYPLDLPKISITASDCLVDPKTSLRYGIHSVFDGNPATSYVENTEDDFAEISFSGLSRYGFINKIAIINGYAANNSLYYDNNRIKRIGSVDYKYSPLGTGERDIGVEEETTLKDGLLTYQFFSTNQASRIMNLENYPGLKYNDTCFAELNVRTNKGWLFGDIDNEN